MSHRVHHFERNTVGRDFIVGDLHGCFDALYQALSDAAFHFDRDRVFSVGDLVDRGGQSQESIDWLAYPWFHAVRGNHEQMAIDVAAGRHSIINYIANGGGWFVGLPESRQRLYAEAFNALPFAIEIDHAIGKVGIVHAEVPGYDWDEFTVAMDADQSNNKFRNLTERVLWSRGRINKRDQTPIANVDRVYVGHTPLKDYAVLGNVYYVDTGCVFGGHLTLLEIA